ncbi:MAG: hypothetical protein PHV37_09150 [Candidatus Gastranaerophilales bacterium]|nr:hypothetical protein [Candidatus Gastranaerophilales bacterium]
MTKDRLTKEELEQKQKELKDDIERLKKIIKASDKTTFEIIIEDLKRQMHENVNNEAWGTLKSCIKEVDNINGTQEFIEKQSTLLSKKETELEETIQKINNYQPSIFEINYDKDAKALPTGYKNGDSSIVFGDIYKSAKESTEPIYYLVRESTTSKGKVAVISSADAKNEMFLNSPKTLQLITEFDYIGNIYIKDIDHDNAVSALKLITGES